MAVPPPLMCIDFIDDEFDFPVFMVSACQVARRILSRIQQGRDQPMGFSVARQGWVLEHILDDTNHMAKIELSVLGRRRLAVASLGKRTLAPEVEHWENGAMLNAKQLRLTVC